jgi:hypothetical protein
MKVGDKVVVEGKEAEVVAVHESGAIDAKLPDGTVTYVLPGNIETTMAFIPAADWHVSKPVPTSKVEKIGEFTTITR